jgi:thioesterase domain-containing protein
MSGRSTPAGHRPASPMRAEPALSPPTVDALIETLHSDLPPSRLLGVEVLAAQVGSVTLGAPLAANRNHLGTAFAGSLNAVATLAGWSWLWVYLHALGEEARIVIQDSAIQYLRPVGSDFQATCDAPGPRAVQRFLRALHRSGRGRLELAVTLSDQRGPAARFAGRYVAEHIPSRRRGASAID